MYWSIIAIKNHFRANKNDFWHIRLLHKMAKDIVNQNTDEKANSRSTTNSFAEII